MHCLTACAASLPPPRRLNEVAQELEGRLLYGSRENMDCGEPPLLHLLQYSALLHCALPEWY